MESKNTIHILSQHVANQIAAGEVVQRPESVVKELVENAVDAGATEVTVIVKGAGKQLIHIIDNGSGMSQEDLALCVVRHATSKISSEADLHSISTLGFRGEALASIAAVADLEIRTRRSSDSAGWTLVGRPGQPPEIKPSATDVGTQILVRSLFYNVPARRKFLKSDLTEFRHIAETVQKMALARPDVRFVLYDDSTLVFETVASDLVTRVASVLAVDPRRDLVEVHHEEAGVTVTGFVGKPHVARQSRSGQALFLNHRPIVSRSIAHAIASSYEHLLDSGQHPLFVLQLQLDPRRVDVNVHPQKHEVKFDDERAIYAMVQRAVTDALSKGHVVPSFLAGGPIAQRPLQSLPLSPSGGSIIVNRHTGEVLSGSADRSQRERSAPYTQAMQTAYGDLFARREDEAPKAVFQVGSQFLVSTSSEGIVVVDQQAAHERVIYERLMRRSSTEAAEQSLLFAVTVRLGPSRGAIMREYATEFASIGFRLEVELDGSVHVHAVPTDVSPGSEDTVLTEILDALEEIGTVPRESRKESLASVYASKQAVRRGQPLSNTEAVALVRDLFECNAPHTSPHGQPTYLIITIEELIQRCNS